MKVMVLPAAERDLGSLYSYIKDELNNEIAAHNIASKILQKTQLLEDLPEIGANLGNIDQRLDGYRYLVVDNYLIVYRVSDKVYLVRILYARSDYLQLLNR